MRPLPPRTKILGGTSQVGDNVFAPFQSLFRVLEEKGAGYLSMSEVLAEDFRRNLPRLEAMSDRLADLGWTLPMNIAPRDLMEVARRKNSDLEIESLLSSYFLANNF